MNEQLTAHAQKTIDALNKVWKNRGSCTRGFPKWEQELMKSACEALNIPVIKPPQ